MELEFSKKGLKCRSWYKVIGIKEIMEIGSKDWVFKGIGIERKRIGLRIEFWEMDF